jgi:SAM-dependent methyltransferase
MASTKRPQRRALSMPRAPGRIATGGDRRLAEAAAEALGAPRGRGGDEIAESLTHPFHSYPARLHPATARVLVEVVGAGTILDPFCGSGTVLVEVQAAGQRAIGVDLNPLAILVARAKTWTTPAARRRQLRDTGHAISGAVQAAGKAARRAGAEPVPQRRPAGFDPNARNRRLAAWFAPHVRRELELIAGHLDELAERDAELAQVLTACLSAILYKVSSRTSDTDPTWVDRNVARGAAARQFALRVDLLAAGLADLATARARPAELHERDARTLGDVIPAGGVAGVITSPPYAGTYDYAEHQRLRFDFLALRHRTFDAGEIGSRRSFADSLPAERAWRRALGASLDAIAHALAPGGAAAIVIGDSFAGGRAHRALDDLRAALPGDLAVAAWASQERPMLGGAERRGFADRPKAEHVILLRRL